MRKSFLYSIILVAFTVQAQLPVGTYQWRPIVSFNKAIAVVHTGDVVYTATERAIQEYEVATGALTSLNTVNGMAEIGVTKLGYYPERDMLIIGYKSGNLDLYFNGGVFNIPFIKTSNIPGNKEVFHINVVDQFAYVSTGIGVVVVDLENLEVKDTYFPSNSTTTYYQASAIYGDSIYVATNVGLYSADKDYPFLNDFNAWQRQELFPASVEDSNFSLVLTYNDEMLSVFDSYNNPIDTVYRYNNGTWEMVPELTGNEVKNFRQVEDGNLVATYYGRAVLYDSLFNEIRSFTGTLSGSVLYPQDAVHENGYFWVADEFICLAKGFDNFNNTNYIIDGPAYSGAFGVATEEDAMVIVNGGINVFSKQGFSRMENESWQSWSNGNTPELPSNMYDYIGVVIDPTDDNHFFVSTRSAGGLVEINHGEVTVYDQNNSTLEGIIGAGGVMFIRDLDIDSRGNLWVGDGFAQRGVKMKDAEGNWFSFDGGNGVSNVDIRDVMVDRNGYIWYATMGGGITVYNPNGTPTDSLDDEYKRLNVNAGTGNLPSNNVKSLAEDEDGRIWVGTEAGLAVIYSPQNIFAGGNYDATQIVIEVDGVGEILFGETNINVITVDGGNRKWIGTENSGVFLQSENVQETIFAFTVDNSPLFSNSCTDIAVNGVTGEVYFAVEGGMIAFRAGATDSDYSYENMYVFPNPITPDYFGVITVAGMAYDSDVKIVDMAGNVVAEGRSEGGTFVWDGRAFNGQWATAGTYMVIAGGRSEDNKNGGRTKFTIIR